MLKYLRDTLSFSYFSHLEHNFDNEPQDSLNFRLQLREMFDLIRPAEGEIQLNLVLNGDKLHLTLHY